MKKITVALTGGIGAGKSTVANMLAEYGATVISGDELGKQVLNEDADVRRALIGKLGGDVIDSEGELNRRLIASLVFSDLALTKWLTSLTFPGIYTRWNQLRDKSDAMIVVFDAALIFEWNIQSEFDLVLTVVASEESAFFRSAMRFSESDFYRRSSVQISDTVKTSGADCVIRNDGTPEQLQQQVYNFWQTHILPLTA